MPSVDEITPILTRITEIYENPVPIGSRCESTVFYRVEDLTEDDLNSCAEYVADRLYNLASPQRIDLFLKLPGGYSFFAERLSVLYAEISGERELIPVEQYIESKISNGHGEKFKGKNAILVTDVITTARSTLEAHTRATLKNISILCWATLIDRTFGPGPVPVVSAFTGEPVSLVARL